MVSIMHLKETVLEEVLYVHLAKDMAQNGW
jgi:hypothetical protein